MDIHFKQRFTVKVKECVQAKILYIYSCVGKTIRRDKRDIVKNYYYYYYY